MPRIAEQEGIGWQGSQPIIQESGVGTGNPRPVQSLLPESVARTQSQWPPDTSGCGWNDTQHCQAVDGIPGIMYETLILFNAMSLFLCLKEPDHLHINNEIRNVASWYVQKRQNKGLSISPGKSEPTHYLLFFLIFYYFKHNYCQLQRPFEQVKY